VAALQVLQARGDVSSAASSRRYLATVAGGAALLCSNGE